MQLSAPLVISNARHTVQSLAQATSNTNGTAGTAGSSGTTGTGSSSSTGNTVGSLTSEQTFLQLLVAQIQNQDPLNPTDSIQFVSQLVQYAELGQLMGINQGVQNLTGSGTSTSSSSGSSTGGTSQNLVKGTSST
jgi:flagellar basal-body rod modification protein FlgD